MTEEFNGAKTLTSSLNEDEVLDMQKGDKANVLRKLSESGKSRANNIHILVKFLFLENILG